MPQTFEFEVFDATALDCIVRGGFRVGGNDYAGLRQIYANDELAWDNNDEGRWQAGMSPLTIPSSISIKDAVPLVRLPNAERDTVLRVGSGNDVEVRWSYLYGGSGSYPCRVMAWDCASGSTVHDEIENDSGSLISGLPDGAYTVAVCISDAAPEHITEEYYTGLTGLSVSVDYYYEEAGSEYFFDYERNLGTVPSDPNHPLNVLRKEVLDAGTQLDRPEWIQYVSGHENWGSQWAMAKFIVGAGSWNISPGVLASPFPALIGATTSTSTVVINSGNIGSYTIPFDPFARSVVHYYKAKDGNEYICGERSCEDGTETALWGWNSGNPTLLGTSQNYSTGYCECGGLQSAHEGRRIAELDDGSIVVQTLCSLFKYDPYRNSIEERLVPWPEVNQGHPGGRSLVSYRNTVSFTTESFGGGKENPIAARFYNTYETRNGDKPLTTVGTVAHLDGNLAVWRDNVYGVTQSDHDLTVAMQYISIMTGQGWVQSPMSSFEATRYFFNRLCRIGWHLVSYGSYRETGDPLLLSNDGYFATFGDFSYRIRHCDAVTNPSGYETGLAPGSLPTDSQLYPKRLIEIGDRETGRVLDDEPVIEVDCTDAQCQLNDFGEGAVWFQLPLAVWSGELSGVAVYDTGEWPSPSQVKSFTEYFDAMLEAKDMLLWARIDSDEPVSELDSYNIPVPRIGDLWMLPRAARKKVEVVVVLPAEASAITPPRLQSIC